METWVAQHVSVTTGAPKLRHIGNTIKNANRTSISCHSHSFRVTEGVNSFIFYFNGLGSNAFKGFEISLNAEWNHRSGSGQPPEPEP